MKNKMGYTNKSARQTEVGEHNKPANNKSNEPTGKFDGLTEKLRHSSDPESDVAGHDLRETDPRKTDFDPTIQYTDGRD